MNDEKLRVRSGLIAVALVAMVAACGHLSGGAPPDGWRTGYLILGPVGARAYGYSPNDSLVELASRQVPSAVVEAALGTAVRIGYDPNCNRFFGRARRYIAVMRFRCIETPNLRYRDGISVGAFTGDGRSIGEFFGSVPPGVIAELEPFKRDPMLSLPRARRSLPLPRGPESR
jgi:hypothetical protein